MHGRSALLARIAQVAVAGLDCGLRPFRGVGARPTSSDSEGAVPRRFTYRESVPVLMRYRF